MTSNPLQLLEEQLRTAFGERIKWLDSALDELTVSFPAEGLGDIMLALRDRPEFSFAQLSDLCGLDYSSYARARENDARFAVVYHLLSIEHNRRLRVRVFCQDDDFPVIESVVSIWPGANWFEREAFDLYGIVFTGHPDLRRLLTDYGFVGYPFRKDFPLSGNVEMRYDPEQQRVIYQPVTIEPREIVPRVVREENYGDVD